MPEDGIPSELAQATTDLENALKAFHQALRAAGLPPRPPSTPLFDALRQWRTSEARTRQVPPYIIASDAALRGIEAARPKDVDGLAAVRGFGRTKAETYATPILELLAQAPAA